MAEDKSVSLLRTAFSAAIVATGIVSNLPLDGADELLVGVPATIDACGCLWPGLFDSDFASFVALLDTLGGLLLLSAGFLSTGFETVDALVSGFGESVVFFLLALSLFEVLSVESCFLEEEVVDRAEGVLG